MPEVIAKVKVFEIIVEDVKNIKRKIKEILGFSVAN